MGQTMRLPSKYGHSSCFVTCVRISLNPFRSPNTYIHHLVSLLSVPDQPLYEALDTYIRPLSVLTSVFFRIITTSLRPIDTDNHTLIYRASVLQRFSSAFLILTFRAFTRICPYSCTFLCCAVCSERRCAGGGQLKKPDRQL